MNCIFHKSIKNNVKIKKKPKRSQMITEIVLPLILALALVLIAQFRKHAVGSIKVINTELCVFDNLINPSLDGTLPVIGNLIPILANFKK